jgi:hypothetical protein
LSSSVLQNEFFPMNNYGIVVFDYEGLITRRACDV